MKSIFTTLILILFSTFILADETYAPPKLSLDSHKSLQKLKVKKAKWEEPSRLHSEKDVERSIASEGPGRKPSSAKRKLFEPWPYKPSSSVDNSDSK